MGASPEMLVRVEGEVVETMPIAGTRRRGANSEEDERLQQELLADPKERAEHELLVDLGRNDLGRVARFDSVELVKHAEVQRFSHVMHMVSQVRARLAPGKAALDALYACFPAGTVSGVGVGLYGTALASRAVGLPKAAKPIILYSPSFTAKPKKSVIAE